MASHNPSPASTLSRSSRKSLAHALAAASSAYNDRFLAAFRPAAPQQDLEPIELLPGIRSDSGVAKVFELDPRIPHERHRKRDVIRRLFGRVEGELAPGSSPPPRRGEGRSGGAGHDDRLPKMANVFTGVRSAGGSSVFYPSSSCSSSSSASASASSLRPPAASTSTSTSTPPSPLSLLSLLPSTRRCRAHKTVTFALAREEAELGLEDLQTPPSPPPPPPPPPPTPPELVERLRRLRRPVAVVELPSGPAVGGVVAGESV